jgi:hypothetical protein
MIKANEDSNARYVVSSDSFAAIRNLLSADGFGDGKTGKISTESFSETFFDSHDSPRLRHRHWTFSVRRTADQVLAVLRYPDGTGVFEASYPLPSTMHESLLGKDPSKNISVIAERLARAGFPIRADRSSEDLDSALLTRGVTGAFRSLGLDPLFTVDVEKTSWVLFDSSGHYAVITLGAQSFLADSLTGDPFVDYELDIRVTRPGAEEWGRVVKEKLLADHLHVPASAHFDRGLAIHRALTLDDKIETKLTATQTNRFDALVEALTLSPSMLKGFTLTELVRNHRIEDVYYDTMSFDLARADCYLRLRHEGRGLEIVFRRIIDDKRTDLPVQEEIKIREEANSDSKNAGWLLLKRSLGELGIMLGGGPPRTSEDWPRTLLDTELRPTIALTIDRDAWTASATRNWEEEPTEGGAQPVAKIKYDRVTYFSTRHREADSYAHTEFEITGVEDEPSAPTEFDRGAYDELLEELEDVAFDVLFRKVNSTGTVTIGRGSKYRLGLDALGLLPLTPTDGPGSALVRRSFKATTPPTDVLYPLAQAVRMEHVKAPVPFILLGMLLGWLVSQMLAPAFLPWYGSGIGGVIALLMVLGIRRSVRAGSGDRVKRA